MVRHPGQRLASSCSSWWWLLDGCCSTEGAGVRCHGSQGQARCACNWTLHWPVSMPVQGHLAFGRRGASPGSKGTEMSRRTPLLPRARVACIVAHTAGQRVFCRRLSLEAFALLRRSRWFLEASCGWPFEHCSSCGLRTCCASTCSVPAHATMKT